jgi:glycosyltransferase involved in cell wall biosynthesis
MPKPAVVLFSSLLLPPSQTFIRAQGEELRQFTPYYVGSRLTAGLTLPSERTLVINQGGVLGITQEVLFKFSGLAPKLYQQVQKLNPALIHAQFGLSGALALPLARSLNVPLIVHFRGADATVKDEAAYYSSINHWVYFQRREALKREVRLFITVSKFIKEKLLVQGFNPDKVVVHYHGVDTEAFQPDPTVVREPTVLFVGRLTEKKGCEYLIQAIAQVQAVMPNVQLVLIGDGPLKQSLEALAARTLRSYSFLGLQPQQVVRSWMNRSKLLAAPSVTASQGDSEGLPNVVVEAQAMGLPVVSTVHAGIPEAVIHGETGFLAAERDWNSLAMYMLQLLQSPSLWQRFSCSGQEHVRTHFNRRRQTQVLEQIYQAVLQEKVSS